MGKNKALQALLMGVDFTAPQAEALNIITQYVPQEEMDSFLGQLLAAVKNFELCDIVMYKEIGAASIKDGYAGQSLNYSIFLNAPRKKKRKLLSLRF